MTHLPNTRELRIATHAATFAILLFVALCGFLLVNKAIPQAAEDAVNHKVMR